MDHSRKKKVGVKTTNTECKPQSLNELTEWPNSTIRGQTKRQCGSTQFRLAKLSACTAYTKSVNNALKVYKYNYIYIYIQFQADSVGVNTVYRHKKRLANATVQEVHSSCHVALASFCPSSSRKPFTVSKWRRPSWALWLGKKEILSDRNWAKKKALLVV